MMAFTLAHLSDPHLGPLPRLRLGDLAGKRALGAANWRRGRHNAHRPEVLARLVAHLKAAAPDHIALTGDLVNIGLPSEFENALSWLSELGDAADVSIAPGNHDAYVPGALRKALRIWSAYLAGDDAPATAGTVFPYLRRRGPIGIVGLSSAIATGPFLATGRIGAEQRRRLGEALDELAGEGRFRVVLIHHPPFARLADWSKRLTDASAVRRVLRRSGAELVLHGHTHRSTLRWIEGPGRPIPVVGIASASAMAPRAREQAAYNLIEISGTGPADWRVALTTFADEPAGIIPVRQLDPLYGPG